MTPHARRLSKRPAAVMAVTLAATFAIGCADTPTGFDNRPPALDVVALSDHMPESCGPGFWKNQMTADVWAPTGYAPDQPISEVFAGAQPYANHLLSDALAFGGGNGVNGAKLILLRAAVAAALNAGHPGIDYAMSLSEVTDAVEAVLAGGQRKAMLALAEELDGFNDGGCIIDPDADLPDPDGLPDLIVTDIVIISQETLVQRQVTIKNVGTAPAELQGVVIQGHWSTDPNLDVHSDPAAGGRSLSTTSLVLAPGASITVFNSGPFVAGYSYLLETVDSNNSLAESDETNNTTALLVPQG